MNYTVYYNGVGKQFTFNYLEKVGDLQSIILEAYRIKKENLLYILWDTEILGIDIPFQDSLISKNLFNTSLFVVIDSDNQASGSKEEYLNWLDEVSDPNQIINSHRQIMYHNILHNTWSPAPLNFMSVSNPDSPTPSSNRSSNQRDSTQTSSNFTFGNSTQPNPTTRTRPNSTNRTQSSPTQASSTNRTQSSSNSTTRASSIRTTTPNNTTRPNSTRPTSIFANSTTGANRPSNIGSYYTNLIPPGSSSYTNITSFPGSSSSSSTNPHRPPPSPRNTTSTSTSGQLTDLFTMLLSPSSMTGQSSLFDTIMNMDLGEDGPQMDITFSTASYNIPVGTNFWDYLNGLESVPVTLSRDLLETLPTFLYSELPNDIKNGETNPHCTICLQDYQDDDQVRVLLCKHYFHKNCVDTWLSEQNVRCPLCRHDSRQPVTQSNEEDEPER